MNFKNKHSQWTCGQNFELSAAELSAIPNTLKEYSQVWGGGGENSILVSPLVFSFYEVAVGLEPRLHIQN